MERIRIGVAHRGAGLAPVFAAVESGALTQAGVEAELIHLPGHPAALEALIGGEVDVINTVGPELLLANHRLGGDAVVVASAIGRSAVQVSARPGLDHREALRGRRWACVARADADECAIAVAFESWGWSLARDAEIVPTGPGRSLGRLLDPARVDVAIMHAPEAFQAERQGWQVVEDMARLDIAFQNSCAATTRRFAAARPDAVRRYVRAYAEAVWRFRTDAAFGLDVLGRHMDEADPSVIARSWALFARVMGGMLYPSLEGMGRAGRVLHGLGALPAAPPAEASVDLGPVAELEAAGGFLDIMGVPPSWRAAPQAEGRQAWPA